MIGRVTILVAALGLVAGSGCLFEPECDSYETCTTPEEISLVDAGRDAAPDAGDGAANNPSENSDIVGACQLPASECPDSDFYDLGGGSDDPVGCDRSGNLDYFEFSEEAKVCSGGQRGYRALIESCDSPYILVAQVWPNDGCFRQADVEIDFAGLECGDDEVLCETSDGVIRRSFLVHPDRVEVEVLEMTVGSTSGGFEYFVEIYARR